MSVYIKGVEMPKSCSDCPMCGLYSEHKGDVHRCDITFYPVEYEEGLDGRHKDCPLVPVPPHGRLIDADALKASLVFAESTAEWAVPALRAVLMVIDETPTIIPESKEGEA